LATRAITRDQVVATAKHQERVEYIRQQYQIQTLMDNRAATAGADIILLCVKPQALSEVLREIREVVTEQKLLVSIAASIPTRYIEETLGKPIPVIRGMPNTPCLVHAGMTGLCRGKYARSEHLDKARAIFDSVGRTVILDEKHLDAVTGLSASGPAFIYIVIESLAEGGVKVGLPRHVATELASQAVLGAAKMVLETKEHPALLKDMVTTPAGCTIDGILKLEEGGLRVTLINAVVEATKRAAELLQDAR